MLQRNWWKKPSAKSDFDKDKMAENGIDPMGIMQMIQANNSSSPSGVLSIRMRNI
jgi:multidrug efflux pump subunit AcrB